MLLSYILQLRIALSPSWEAICQRQVRPIRAFTELPAETEVHDPLRGGCSNELVTYISRRVDLAYEPVVDDGIDRNRHRILCKNFLRRDVERQRAQINLHI